MECLRCGRKTEEGDVFCQACLEGMKEYPVKPGTVVHLPPKTTEQAQKAAARRKPTPQEIIAVLRKRIRRLQISLAAALAALVAVAVLAWFFGGDEVVEYLPGQNYTAEQSSQSTAGE